MIVSDVHRHMDVIAGKLSEACTASIEAIGEVLEDGQVVVEP
jgi:hypothetical protein